MQLSLFNNNIDWNNITTEWLFNYLNSNYPELNFKIKDKWYYFNPQTEKDESIEEIVTETKKIICSFYISKLNLTEYTMWNNPILVHCNVMKQHGDYQGMGFAVNSFQDFQKGVEQIIEKFNEWTEKY